MNRRTQILTLTLALALLAFARPGGAEEPGPSELREGLRVRVERLASIGGPVTETESLYASQGLPRFYLEGSLLPVWVGSPQALDRARRMAAILGGAEAEGLRSADYHLAAIEAGLAASGRAGAAALLDLELLLTDSALVFANHLLAGRLDPETVNPEWTLGRRQVDIISFLHDAIESGQLEKEYAQLLPRYPGYVGLRQALGHLRDVALAGGWPEVPGGATLRPGNGILGSRPSALGWRRPATSRRRRPPPRTRTSSTNGSRKRSSDSRLATASIRMASWGNRATPPSASPRPNGRIRSSSTWNVGVGCHWISATRMSGSTWPASTCRPAARAAPISTCA